MAGVGRLLYIGIQFNDFPLVAGSIMVLLIYAVLVNLIVALGAEDLELPRRQTVSSQQARCGVGRLATDRGAGIVRAAVFLRRRSELRQSGVVSAAAVG